ncbi:GIDE domain-containing protein [Haloarchaeobius amylolyticus]|uniref:RING-type E3 ubiquitin transferase n=1 Tax=Haloarchaeobius amylolyticus TaxID=1198296 RepID=A0ABD6BJK0_9EURY
MYSGPIATIIHLTAGVFGIGFLWQAGILFRQRIMMTNPDAQQIQDITDGDTVALEGTVQAKQDETGGLRTTTAPLSGETCVLATWRVEEFFGHEFGQNSGWTEQAENYVTTPFELTDGSGAITIDIRGEQQFLETEFNLSGLESPQETVAVEEDVPPEIQQFEETHDIPERTPAYPKVPSTESGPTQADRRYYEATVTTGDSLFVVGTATDTDGETEYVVRDSTGRRFYISDKGRNGAARERAGAAVLFVGVGLLLLWYTLQPLL